MPAAGIWGKTLPPWEVFNYGSGAGHLQIDQRQKNVYGGIPSSNS